MKAQISKKQKGIRIAIIVLASLLVLLVVAPYIVSIAIYESIFNVRLEPYAPLAYRLEDFEGLQRERYEFLSNKGKTLVGYRYFVENSNPKAIVVFGHGFGSGGHVTYMHCINYFAQNGFLVFAYDAQGNGESQGKIGGLPQQIRDMNKALEFVANNSDFPNLPICLFGHSWGGYTVSSVLYDHPEVKAVCEIAGFDSAQDMIKYEGEQHVGGFVNMALPYVNSYEFLKFGRYSTYSATKGFKSSDAKVVVIQSKDDATVPYYCGAGKYYEEFKNDPRFTFILSETGGHTKVFYSQEGIDYADEVDEKFAQYVDSLGGQFTPEQKAQWLEENLDRSKWANVINTQLFEQIAEIFSSAVA